MTWEIIAVLLIAAGILAYVLRHIRWAIELLLREWDD